jgi:DNA-binding CsgD family transcriptional regulator
MVVMSCMLHFEPATSQIKTIGNPFIINYERETYQASTQNWAIAQSSKGIMYFGNNMGILEFNGAHWKITEITNNSIVRSLLSASDGHIYVGAFNEFGYLESDSTGNLYYQSLVDFLPPEAKEFSDIWRIFEFNGQIMFQAYEGIFLYNREIQSIEIINPFGRFGFAFTDGKDVFINDSEIGLLQLTGSHLRQVQGGGVCRDMEIWSLLPYRDGQMLLGTQDNGFFVFSNGSFDEWETEANEFIINNKLYTARSYRNQYLLLGSISDGLIVTDLDGRIIQHLNRDNGLQNNTILSMAIDAQQNVWLGLDNGIDYIQFNSALSQIGLTEDLGQGYASVVHKDTLYLGTNQGLFKQMIPFSEMLQRGLGKFELVPGTSGQVWSLFANDQELLVCHHKGTFSILDGRIRQISFEPGSWMILRLRNHEDMVLQGSYNCLSVLRLGTGQERTTFLHKLEGFHESCRFMIEEEEGTIWMSHGYKGIFKINLSSDYRQVSSFTVYDSQSGLPSDYDNEIVKLRGQIRFYSEDSGFYQYNPVTDSMEPNIVWDEIFGKGFSKIIPEGNDAFWYVKSDEAGLATRINDTLWEFNESQLSPLKNHFVDAFENFHTIDPSNVLIGIQEGFIHYDPTYVVPGKYYNFTTLIEQVEIVFGRYNNQSHRYFYPLNMTQARPRAGDVPFLNNMVTMTYVSSFYQGLGDMEYQVKMEGLNETWSGWSSSNQKTYSNLREGTYTFFVRGKNSHGQISNDVSFQFRILPPWYRSWYAYLIYASVVFLVVLVVNFFYRRTVRIEKRRMLIEKQRELIRKDREMARESELAENEIMKLKTEKLQSDIRHKSKELANSTMSIIQKNKMLTEIKNELDHLAVTDHSQLQYDLKRLIKKINRNIDDKNEWQVFETNFDKVHENFLKSIHAAYPELTPKDLRLCAYLRMNLQTKEIAPLLNISIRGVEISRYRLRKKLNLPHDANLTEFLMDLDTPAS